MHKPLFAYLFSLFANIFNQLFYLIYNIKFHDKINYLTKRIILVDLRNELTLVNVSNRSDRSILKKTKMIYNL